MPALHLGPQTVALLLVFLSATAAAAASLQDQSTCTNETSPSMINYIEQYKFVDNLNTPNVNKRALLREIVNVQAEIYLTCLAVELHVRSRLERDSLKRAPPRPFWPDDVLRARADLRLKVTQLEWTRLFWIKLRHLVAGYNQYWPIEMRQLNRTIPSHLDELTLTRELEKQDSSYEKYKKQSSIQDDNSQKQDKDVLLEEMDKVIEDIFECQRNPENQPDWTAVAPICGDIDLRLAWIRDHLDHKFIRLVIENQLQVNEILRPVHLERLQVVSWAELQKFLSDARESLKKPEPTRNPEEGVDEKSLKFHVDIDKIPPRESSSLDHQ